MSELTEQYKIIQQFTRQYAGEGNWGQARAAVSTITPVAEKGNAKAQYQLGQCYEEGIGVERNLAKAFKLYWLASDQCRPAKERLNKDSYQGAIRQLPLFSFLSAPFPMGVITKVYAGMNRR